jgi:putative redox protein
MEAKNEEGNTLFMDGPPSVGGHNKAMRPTQLLLSSLGGCSMIDVIMILKKQKQEIESIEVEVESERVPVEEYSLFKEILLHFKIKGKVDRDKVERAVNLSLDKYCSVSKTLEPTAKITYKITIN